MVAQLVIPRLRLSPGQVACMAASCCFRMMWRFAPSCASVVMPELCVALVGARLVVRGGDLSCEAETCRVPRRVEASRKCSRPAKNWASFQ
jgi:hypothetical protein